MAFGEYIGTLGICMDIVIAYTREFSSSKCGSVLHISHSQLFIQFHWLGSSMYIQTEIEYVSKYLQY